MNKGNNMKAVELIDVAMKLAKERQLGLCSSLQSTRFENQEKMPHWGFPLTERVGELMRDWPEYSGDHAFPVPSPDPVMSASEAYGKFRNTENMWSPNHPYGAARLRMIEWIRNELAKGNE